MHVLSGSTKSPNSGFGFCLVGSLERIYVMLRSPADRCLETTKANVPEA